MAGLLAAAVAARHFDEVTIVERDVLPEDSANRKGVPQGQHAHALLIRGLNVLEALFPGIQAELRAGGSTEMEFGKTLYWHHGDGLKAECEGGLHALAQSRPFLEFMVRKRVRATANIRVRDDFDVLGLVATKDGRGVGGARIRARTEGAEAETVTADIVVDAMGRGSRGPRFLEELGYQRAEEIEVEVNTGYATRIYERPEPYPYPWRGMYILGTPAQGSRVGVVFPIEGNRWMVAFSGIVRDYPPSDEAGLMEFAKSLPSTAIHDAIARAKPLTDIATYRFPSHLRRRYERLSRAPEGFLGMGDAVASFNPIYGQGMTTAAMGAETLDACLREARRKAGAGEVRGLAKTYHARLGRELDVPWMLSTTEDLADPRVKGERPPGFAVMRAYVERVHTLCQSEPEIVRRFYRVMNMIAPPTELFHPSVALPVAKLAFAGARTKIEEARAKFGFA
jgi:2-polyprenyl-6-methoxyphenol hydroxylase-like FAD-dependent oxidoreductase